MRGEGRGRGVVLLDFGVGSGTGGGAGPALDSKYCRRTSEILSSGSTGMGLGREITRGVKGRGLSGVYGLITGDLGALTLGTAVAEDEDDDGEEEDEEEVVLTEPDSAFLRGGRSVGTNGLGETTGTELKGGDTQTSGFARFARALSSSATSGSGEKRVLLRAGLRRLGSEDDECEEEEKESDSMSGDSVIRGVRRARRCVVGGA